MTADPNDKDKIDHMRTMLKSIEHSPTNTLYDKNNAIFQNPLRKASSLPKFDLVNPGVKRPELPPLHPSKPFNVFVNDFCRSKPASLASDILYPVDDELFQRKNDVAYEQIDSPDSPLAMSVNHNMAFEAACEAAFEQKINSAEGTIEPVDPLEVEDQWIKIRLEKILCGQLNTLLKKCFLYANMHANSLSSFLSFLDFERGFNVDSDEPQCFKLTKSKVSSIIVTSVAPLYVDINFMVGGIPADFAMTFLNLQNSEKCCGPIRFFFDKSIAAQSTNTQNFSMEEDRDAVNSFVQKLAHLAQIDGIPFDKNGKAYLSTSWNATSLPKTTKTNIYHSPDYNNITTKPSLSSKHDSVSQSPLREKKNDDNDEDKDEVYNLHSIAKKTSPPSYNVPPAYTTARRSSPRLNSQKSADTYSYTPYSIVPKNAALDLPDAQPLFVYPEPSKGDDSPKNNSVLITENEMRRLEPGCYLNDTLVDFDIRHTQEWLKPAKTHIFSSFFFTRLNTQISNNTTSIACDLNVDNELQLIPGYEEVAKWTEGLDLFTMDRLIFPINEALHWYAAFIINPGGVLIGKKNFDDNAKPEIVLAPDSDTDSQQKDQICTIFVYDSLGVPRPTVVTRLKAYLMAEARKHSEHAINTDAICEFNQVPRGPFQPNATDCGLFMLHAIECACKAPNPSEWVQKLLKYERSSSYLSQTLNPLLNCTPATNAQLESDSSSEALWFKPGQAVNRRCQIKQTCLTIIQQHELKGSLLKRSNSYLENQSEPIECESDDLEILDGPPPK